MLTVASSSATHYMHDKQPDYYELLDVPENTNDAWLKRAFETAQQRISADTALSEKDREQASRTIDAAFRTLSSRVTREVYDEKLHRRREQAANAEAGLLSQLSSPKILIAIALIAVLGGGMVWQYSREQERIRFERERIAQEQAEQKRLAEAEAQRQRDRQRIQEEIQAQKEAVETQHKLALEAGQAEMQKKAFVADDRYVPAQQQQSNLYADRYEGYQRQSEEQKQRYEDEQNLRRARAEVERQKRFLEQREHEDAMERARKDPSYNNRDPYRRY